MESGAFSVYQVTSPYYPLLFCGVKTMELELDLEYAYCLFLSDSIIYITTPHAANK